MQQQLTNKQIKILLWFNRIFRWGMGTLFTIVGIVYNSYIAIAFGVAMIITGFFKPKRCLGNDCEIKK